MLVVFSDGLAPFPQNLALSQLMVTRYHFFEINTEHSTCTTSYLELNQSLVSFKVDLDVLNQVQFGFFAFAVHKGIVIKY